MDVVNQKGNTVKSSGKVTIAYIAIGWIAAIISLVKIPFLFGLLGVITGIIANRNGSKAAMPLIIASIVSMAAGLIFSSEFSNYLEQVLALCQP